MANEELATATPATPDLSGVRKAITFALISNTYATSKAFLKTCTTLLNLQPEDIPSDRRKKLLTDSAMHNTIMKCDGGMEILYAMGFVIVPPIKNLMQLSPSASTTKEFLHGARLLTIESKRKLESYYRPRFPTHSPPKEEEKTSEDANAMVEVTVDSILSNNENVKSKRACLETLIELLDALLNEPNPERRTIQLKNRNTAKIVKRHGGVEVLTVLGFVRDSTNRNKMKLSPTSATNQFLRTARRTISHRLARENRIQGKENRFPTHGRPNEDQHLSTVVETRQWTRAQQWTGGVTSVDVWRTVIKYTHLCRTTHCDHSKYGKHSLDTDVQENE